MNASILLPPSSLLVLAGPAGSGKSALARRSFVETAVVSSDRCRALIADDEADQAVSYRAFRLFYRIVEERLALGRFTAADSTALVRPYRRHLKDIARRHGRPAYLVALDLPLELCLVHNRSRERRVDEAVIARQHATFRRSIARAEEEGFDGVWVLTGEPELENLELRLEAPPAADRMADPSGTAPPG